MRCEINNNRVERLHGTLKDRVKPTRGLKDKDRVSTLLEGRVVYYNYLRPHESLGGRTIHRLVGGQSRKKVADMIEKTLNRAGDEEEDELGGYDGEEPEDYDAHTVSEEFLWMLLNAENHDEFLDRLMKTMKVLDDAKDRCRAHATGRRTIRCGGGMIL